MRVRACALSVCLFAMIAAAVAGRGNDMQSKPIPPAGKQFTDAATAVRQVYAADLAAARQPVEKLNLAKKMIHAGADEKRDLAAKFAMLALARDIAADAGDYPTACKAVDEVHNTFDIDALKMRTELAVKCGRSLQHPEQRTELVGYLVELLDDAIAAERFDLTRQVGSLATGISGQVNDAGSARWVQSRVQAARDAEAAFSEAGKALATLKERPADPAANLQVGKYLCFTKGDWEKGLPLLAKGGDVTLKTLAQKELSKAAQPVDLGDDYWAAGEQASGLTRSRFQQRAATWYQKSLADLTGLSRVRVEKRIEEIAAAAQKTGAPGDTLVIWNSHNAGGNDFGVAEVRVCLCANGKTLWTKENLACDWRRDEDCPTKVTLPSIGYTVIRIDVVKYIGQGSSLAEIEVIRMGKNIALGCAAAASDVFDGDEKYGARNLTDGTITSAKNAKGYWVSRRGSKPWIEVDLSKQRSGPG